MDFYDWSSAPTESFTTELLNFENDDNSLLWNDYSWNVRNCKISYNCWVNNWRHIRHSITSRRFPIRIVLPIARDLLGVIAIRHRGVTSWQRMKTQPFPRQETAKGLPLTMKGIQLRTASRYAVCYLWQEDCSAKSLDSAAEPKTEIRSEYTAREESTRERFSRPEQLLPKRRRGKWVCIWGSFKWWSLHSSISSNNLRPKILLFVPARTRCLGGNEYVEVR